MEYCEGNNLKQYLQNRKVVDRKENLAIFKQILKGLSHVHDFEIIHRDLKPENIFLFICNKNSKEIVVKIGDFGLSIQENIKLQKKECELRNSHYISASSLSIGCGTPMYTAPEQNSQSNYDEKVDMFALGLVLLELTNQFKTSHEKTTIIESIRNEEELPKCLLKKYAIEGRIIKNLCQTAPNLRWSSKKLLKSKLIKQWEKELPN